MPLTPIISNTSPLVSLWTIKLLSLLPDLYKEVWIPREVEREFLQTEREVRKLSLSNAPWIKTVDLGNPLNVLVYERLDKGEAEVLALAIEHNAHMILIDEKKARQEAQDKGFRVKGTVGILLEGKRKGLINTIKPYINELQENKMRLSKSLIDYVLNEAGETE